MKSWMSKGQRINLKLPSYAMTSRHEKALSKSLNQLLDDHFDNLLGELQADPDEIISMIVAEARRQKKNVRNHDTLSARVDLMSCLTDFLQSEALDGALKIAVITKLMSKSFNILHTEDGETLGVDRVDDTDSPYHGRIPIPTLLDFQLDRLWMEEMKRIRKIAMPKLNQMMFQNQKAMKNNWYLIFLTILILLHNLEAVYQNQFKQKNRYNKTVSLVSL